jgi:hypothetical protein
VLHKKSNAGLCPYHFSLFFLAKQALQAIPTKNAPERGI